jgi:hypothetical protein
MEDPVRWKLTTITGIHHTRHQSDPMSRNLH